MRWMKYLGYAITMCIIWVVINVLYRRNNVSADPDQNDFYYIIKLPKVIKIIYSLVFILGILLFMFFFLVKIKWNGDVTAGHLRFALILAGIGVVIMFFAARWKVIVEGEQITIYPLLQAKRVLQISEIDRIEEGEEGDLTLYKSNKKIVTVENLSENYDRFRNTLKRYGKVE